MIVAKYIFKCVDTHTHTPRRWIDVLRCLSRWDLLLHVTGHAPSDASLFSAQERNLQVCLCVIVFVLVCLCL